MSIHHATPDEGSSYPADWNRRRARVYRRDSWACQVCGRHGGPLGNAELHAHHIIPKSHGGSHALDNLTTLCDRCHAEYHGDQRLLADASSDGAPQIGHVIVGVLTIWWTFGLGNLLYELFHRFRTLDEQSREESRVDGIEDLKARARARKRSRSEAVKDDQHRSVEDDYNDEFDGCSACGRHGLTVRWEPRGERKKKIIECEHCTTLFEEHIVDGDLRLREVRDSSKLDAHESGFDKEIQKHIEAGNLEKSDLPELKEELLSKVDSKTEREYIHEKFAEYGIGD